MVSLFSKGLPLKLKRRRQVCLSIQGAESSTTPLNRGHNPPQHIYTSGTFLHNTPQHIYTGDTIKQNTIASETAENRRQVVRHVTFKYLLGGREHDTGHSSLQKRGEPRGTESEENLHE